MKLNPMPYLRYVFNYSQNKDVVEEHEKRKQVKAYIQKRTKYRDISRDAINKAVDHFKLEWMYENGHNFSRGDIVIIDPWAEFGSWEYIARNCCIAGGVIAQVADNGEVQTDKMIDYISYVKEGIVDDFIDVYKGHLDNHDTIVKLVSEKIVKHFEDKPLAFKRSAFYYTHKLNYSQKREKLIVGHYKNSGINEHFLVDINSQDATNLLIKLKYEKHEN